MFAICDEFEFYGYRRVGAALRQQGRQGGGHRELQAIAARGHGGILGVADGVPSLAPRGHGSNVRAFHLGRIPRGVASH